jgi:hypothetical protein
MAKLTVEAHARWASGAPFSGVPILLAMTVTDDDGIGVHGVTAGDISVRYQEEPENSILASMSDLHEHAAGGPFGQQGNYSLIIKPNEEGPPIFLQDEVFLYVSVRHAGNHGKTVCLARFHSPA